MRMRMHSRFASLRVCVQALCTRGANNPNVPLVRQPTAVSKERFNQVLSVMGKFVPTCKLYNQNVYCNVVGGLQVRGGIHQQLQIWVRSSYMLKCADSCCALPTWLAEA